MKKISVANTKETHVYYKRLYTQILEKIRLSHEIPASDRNFDIEIRNDGDQYAVWLIKNTEAINLSLWISKKYHIKQSDTFACWPLINAITCNTNHLPFRGFLLSLLHEIGHSHQEFDVSAFTMREDIKLFSEWCARYLYVIFSAPWKLLELEHDWFSPWYYFDRLYKKSAKQERDAWAFALAHCRKLEKSGFNALADFKSAREIRDYIDYHLSSYESERWYKKIRHQGQEAIQEYQAMFCQRFNIHFEYPSFKLHIS
ncbi:MAG: hypothetical protein Q8R40_04815 [bacterium]|nr:hypothetical protein [bacterium]